MAIPNELLQLQDEGFFEKVKTGDHRAASLFARLAAYRLNPTANPNSFGWLKKGGGTNIDGYAEDAIVANANNADVGNVYDIVTGTGAPGAALAWNGPLPRRLSDTWEAPKPLTASQLEYLKAGSTTGPVCPDPSAHLPKPRPMYPGDRFFDDVGRQLDADYLEAGQRLNAQSVTWTARTLWDHLHEGLTLSESIAKHRREWRAALGLP